MTEPYCTRCGGVVSSSDETCPYCNSELLRAAEPSTAVDHAPVPPNWYPDPERPGYQRWWKGEEWSNDSRKIPKPLTGKKAGQQAQRTAKAVQAREAEFRRSPVGQAMTAFEKGDGFFELEMPVSDMKRKFFVTDGTDVKHRQFASAARTDTLSQIEAIGWQLIHVGYVHAMTHSTTRERPMAFLGGQEIGYEGVTLGIYLFRRASP